MSQKVSFSLYKIPLLAQEFPAAEKSSGATFVESALVIALVVIAAIGGLGYLGQSIQESMEALTGEVSGEADTRRERERLRNQIYTTTLAKLTNNNVANADQIATAAADAYVAALQMGCNEDEAGQYAAWTAYEAAMDQEIFPEIEALKACLEAETEYRAAVYEKMKDACPPELLILGAEMDAAYNMMTLSIGKSWEEYVAADNIYIAACDAYRTAYDEWARSKIIGENSEVNGLKAAMNEAYSTYESEPDSDEAKKAYLEAERAYKSAYNAAVETMFGDQKYLDLKKAMNDAEEAAKNDTGSWEAYEEASNAYYDYIKSDEYRDTCAVWMDRKLFGDEVAELRKDIKEMYYGMDNVSYDTDWAATHANARTAEDAVYEAITGQIPEQDDLARERTYASSLEFATTILTTLAGGTLAPEIATKVNAMAKDIPVPYDQFFTALRAIAEEAHLQWDGDSTLYNILTSAVNRAELGIYEDWRAQDIHDDRIRLAWWVDAYSKHIPNFVMSRKLELYEKVGGKK
ncbi:MAG: hypothetical protein LBC04_03420 [Holosporaceae bacterium]|nr:hypothetical protein [Holosporaceae bacterium]